MSRMWLIFTLVLMIAFAVGCSGGGTSSPVTPGLSDLNLTSGNAQADPTEGNHFLWGFWQVYIDTASLEFEVVPVRQASMHLNVARLLDNHPAGLSVKVNSIDIGKRLLDFDLTITHPVPDSNLRGFDLRGILMGPGDTIQSTIEPSIIYNAPTGTKLLNADGYTRWWNAVEFFTPGLFGYDINNVIPGFLVPTTTINPYKYFSDPLGPYDNVIPLVNDTNRGTFSTDTDPPSVTRNYQVQFPVISGQPKLGFHYAIDISYALPNGIHPTPKPIEDIPPNANCREPFHIEVSTEGTNAFYTSPENYGDDVVLTIEVFDWGAASNPGGLMGEIDCITVESPTLFDTFTVWPIEPDDGSTPYSAIFHLTIPDVHPTDVTDQIVLVTVNSKGPGSTYAPPNGWSAYPTEAVLSAYTIVDIPVSAFIITETWLDILSPDGGEIWGINSEQTVTWLWGGIIPYVDILLSVDSGDTYNYTLAENLVNTGTFTVDQVMDVPTDDARIKIQSTNEPEFFDISEEDFNIEATIFLDIPNGGEVLMAGTAAVIKWLASDNIESVSILVSSDSGDDFDKVVAMAVPNTGEFVWNNVPEVLIGDDNRIKIFDSADSNNFDISEADFTVVPKPDDPITVLSPNGGEFYDSGNPLDITWGADSSIQNVKILLSTNSGASYENEVIASTQNDGYYKYASIPSFAVGETNRIRVEDASDSQVFDESNMDFSVLAETITVTAPNGWENWDYNSFQSVAWTNTGDPETVSIYLSRTGGVPYDVMIAEDIPNAGHFDFKVGDWTTDTARVRVFTGSDPDSPDAFDDSDNDFTVSPSITLLVPNGNEIWHINDAYDIVWDASAAIENFRIRLSDDSGQEYMFPIVNPTDLHGTYKWTVSPLLEPKATYRVQVADFLAPAIYDESDADFTVLPENEAQIQVGSPNGGEELIAGSDWEIEWEAVPSILNVKIELYKDGGASYVQDITSGVPNVAPYTFIWDIDSVLVPGSDYRLKILDAANYSVYSMSDSSFTIDPPGIALLTPVGGESWEVGNQYQITWDASKSIASLNIDLSVDSGSTYPISIGSGETNDGTCLWTIPSGADGTQCRVRIKDPVSSADSISDANFTILSKGISVSWPNGGETWQIDCPESVLWTSVGGINSVDISLLVDYGSGPTESVIASNVPNTGTYFVVDIGPFLPSVEDMNGWDIDTAKIRVTSHSDADVFDKSDGPFEVPITLGLLHDWNESFKSTYAAVAVDLDNDELYDSIDTGVMQGVEEWLGTVPDPINSEPVVEVQHATGRDTDIDGFSDYYELFGNDTFDPYGLIPDMDGDGLIAPLDNDDDGDFINDGQAVDSDQDSIPNYLEYYGYTYDWLSGSYYLWNGDYTQEYFKSDPMQPSTDEDPYSDSMEVSNLYMDPSVLTPGNHPMVPAYPSIVVLLEGYSYIPIEDITLENGETITHEDTVEHTTSTENSTTDSKTDEINWGVEVSATVEAGFLSGGGSVTATASAGGSHSWTHESTFTQGTSDTVGTTDSNSRNWSEATTTNPAEAACMKLNLKVYNQGTAVAADINPTFTLKIGDINVATIQPPETFAINVLAPKCVYPAQTGTYWVVGGAYGTDDAIVLTLPELQALEMGAPITIEVTQIDMNVYGKNEQGFWENLGDWNQYMARTEAVCAHVFMDVGDGHQMDVMVYADNEPSSPLVLLGDAIVWAGGGRNNPDTGTAEVQFFQADGTYGYAPIEGWLFILDMATIQSYNDAYNAGATSVMATPLSPNSVIQALAPPTSPNPDIHYAGFTPIGAGPYNGVHVYVSAYADSPGELTVLYKVDAADPGTAMIWNASAMRFELGLTDYASTGDELIHARSPICDSPAYIAGTLDGFWENEVLISDYAP